MKLKKFYQFATILALPLSFISCGEEKKAAGEKSEDAPATTATKKGHAEIGKEISVIMDTLMTEMAGIKDVATAKAFGEGLEKHKTGLKGLLKDAEALDPPTDEEKAAVKKLKDAQDGKGDELMGNFLKMMAESPDAEAIGGELEKIMSDKEMDEITDKLENLYGLKDSEEVEDDQDGELKDKDGE